MENSRMLTAAVLVSLVVGGAAGVVIEGDVNQAIDELEREELSSVNITADGRVWECEVTDGKLHPHSKCYSGDREAYLGEKI